MGRTVYIGFGGNIGNVRATFDTARTLLGHRLGREVSFSTVYHSRPLIAPEDPVKVKPPYYNACGAFETDHPPLAILEELLRVERSLGRNRECERRWDSRSIDLDLLLDGTFVVNEPLLLVPHPRLYERDFVLIPLLELDPALRDPHSGRPLQEFLASLPPQSRLVESTVSVPLIDAQQ